VAVGDPGAAVGCNEAVGVIVATSPTTGVGGGVGDGGTGGLQATNTIGMTSQIQRLISSSRSLGTSVGRQPVPSPSLTKIRTD